jgi:GNAT superfamily N-acetyltransferase
MNDPLPVISRARPQDASTILRLIRELAIYEKLEHEVTATPELLAQTLFSPHSRTQVDLVSVDGKSVGFAVYFHNFSTFLGKPGIYLEDLFVLPEYRGRGLGKKLLAHLALQTVTMNGGRLEWSVLDWNQPAIDFYRSLGATPMSEWTTFRLTGEPLKKLALEASQ